MTTALRDLTSAWEPYEPTAERPWNLRRVGHLFRRATFGASWNELHRALRDGPGPTIDRLLRPAEDVVAFDRTHDEDEAAVSQEIATLRAWWLRRMLTTPHPLQEKMVLFWHGHFAVSMARVNDARLMREQLGRLRAQALGSFRSMLGDNALDPAVLLACGAAANRKAQPSEGHARALLEGFCLGPGICTERDLREAARAFTGHFVLRGKLRYFAREHDGGSKRILGQRGAFEAADVVRIAVEHPETSRWIVRRLYRWLIAETEKPVDDTLIAPLVSSFGQDHDIGKLVERMLRSRLFFSARAERRRIKSPVEYVLGIVRACEALVSTTRLARDLAPLGQILYDPPTPQGWAGGKSWINGGTWAARSNLALSMLRASGPYGAKLDPTALARKHGHAAPKRAAGFLLDLLLQGQVDPETRTSLLKTLDHKEPATAIHRF
ncbi:MAG: DUF1800 domain-containing protein, partial [Planctomycetota bacterium]